MCASPWHNDAVHPENLLEPWIALRLVLAVTTVAIFGLAAWPSWTALRRFDVQRASEGQLLLERRFELAASAGKIGALALLAGAFVTVVAATSIYPQIRGAMCPYGLFASAPDGFLALGVDCVAATGAGVLLQVHRVDTELPRLDLLRPLAIGTLLLGTLAFGALVYNTLFWLGLDRTVVASCCSLELDDARVQASVRAIDAPWLLAVGALVGLASAALLALLASRRPTVRRLFASGLASVVALPLGALAVAAVVAPHVFETPTHRCPFCLLRADAGYIGYLLLGAMLFGATRALGMWVSAASLPTLGRAALIERLAPKVLVSAALGWGIALVAGVAPVLRYLALYDGRGLFP